MMNRHGDCRSKFSGWRGGSCCCCTRRGVSVTCALRARQLPRSHSMDTAASPVATQDFTPDAAPMPAIVMLAPGTEAVQDNAPNTPLCHLFFSHEWYIGFMKVPL